MAHDHAPEFDPTDPHGHHAGDDHGHVIVPFRILAGVLIALLFLTLLTVASSRAEVWIAEGLEIHIPQWVNVVIALSIATVKCALVALYFMQLRYDPPLNGIIFSTCLLCFVCFVGFTALDLGTRGLLNQNETNHIVAGGTGGVSRTVRVVNPDGSVEYKVDNVAGPIVTYVKETKPARTGEALHSSYGSYTSTGNMTRPASGLTPGLFSYSPKDDHHHGEHGDADHGEDHADPDQPTDPSANENQPSAADEPESNDH